MSFQRNLFSARAKQLRLENGLPQSTLAKHLGVTPTQISDIENEKTTPSLARAILMAEFFQVSVDYLAGLTDKVASPEQEEPLITRIRNLPDDAKTRLEGYLDGMGY